MTTEVSLFPHGPQHFSNLAAKKQISEVPFLHCAAQLFGASLTVNPKLIDYFNIDYLHDNARPVFRFQSRISFFVFVRLHDQSRSEVVSVCTVFKRLHESKGSAKVRHVPSVAVEAPITLK